MTDCDNFQGGDEMSEKKYIKLTVMIDEDMARRMDSARRKTGQNAAEFNRSCIGLALHVFNGIPTLAQIITTLPVEDHQKITR